MDNTIVLSVGDGYHLGTGKDRIAYAGMPSDKVFSIVVRKWSSSIGALRGTSSSQRDRERSASME